MSMSSSMQKWARAGGWLLVVVGVVVAFVSTRREARAVEDDAPSPVADRVQVLEVQPTTTRATHVFHGVVRSRERALVAFVDGGRVIERLVEVGDHVSEGQVLARLDSTAYRNAVRADSASTRELALQQEQAARDRERAERLSADGVSTTARLEQAVTGFERIEAMQVAARARAAESRRRQREGALRAPFSGVVTDALVQAGELVAAGQPVLRLAGEGGREVSLEVPVEVAAALSPGDEVVLRATGIDAGDPLSARVARGRVRSVTREAASMRGLYPVLVDIEDGMRAGLGVRAELRGPARASLRVPLAAVLDPSGRRPFVWTMVEGRAERAWLRIGSLIDGRVEVLDGLAPGDEVVVRGHQHLLPGDRLVSEAVEPGDAS